MKILPQILIMPLLTLLLPSLVAQDSSFPVTQTAKMDAASYLKPLPENRVVSYKEIAGDFAANQIAAIGKYGDKRITVIGHVSSLSQGHGMSKVLVVTLSDSGGNLPAVKGDFLDGCIPENSEIHVSEDKSTATLIRRDRQGIILSQDSYLSAGQRVGIKGEFKGLKAGAIVLTNCKLLSKAKLHQVASDK